MSDIFPVRLSTVPELKQCPEASQQFGFFCDFVFCTQI
jgi:hypothetical protein